MNSPEGQPTGSPLRPRVDSPRDRAWAAAALAACFGTTVVLALLSDGVHHDDDLTHYLMARWARWFPEYLLHTWGRPGLTLPLAAVAWIGDGETGWLACRLLSAIVTAAGAWMASRLALRLGVGPSWLVIVACYAQPLNTVLAYTTLTENFAALYLVAALLLLEKRRFVAASAVFSLVLLTRHEAFVLVPIWAWAVARSSDPGPRRWAALAVVLWGPIVHNLAFFVTCGRWPVELYLASSGSTDYPPTGALSYLPHALVAIPPLIAGLALAGGLRLVLTGRLVVPLMVASFVVAHCAIIALGVFASGGFARFMVTIAPLVAVLAVAGWNVLRERTRRGAAPVRAPGLLMPLAGVWIVGGVALMLERSAGRIVLQDPRLPVVITVVCGLMVLAVVVAWFRRGARTASLVTWAVLGISMAAWVVHVGWLVRPLDRKPVQRAALRVAQSLDAPPQAGRPVFTTHPWVSFGLGMVEDPRVHKGRHLLAAMPVGSIVIWDAQYCDNDYHGIAETVLADDPGYRRITLDGTRSDEAGVFRIYEKIRETPAPSGAETMYPPNLMAGPCPETGAYYIRPDRKR